MELIKYIIGIPLFSTLIISIIGPLAKKYAQFQRWDFFHAHLLSRLKQSNGSKKLPRRRPIC